MKKESRWEIVFIIVAFLVTCYVVMIGDFFSKKFSIEIGQIATETIYAPFQVENPIATERKRDQVEETIQDIYKQEKDVEEVGIDYIKQLFDYVYMIKTNNNIAEQFNMSATDLLSDKSPIPLYDDSYEVLLALSEQRLLGVETVCIETYSSIMKLGVRSSENKSIDVRDLLAETDLTAIEQKLAYDIIITQIKPNIIIDEVATEEAKLVARESVEAIYILQGEIIVTQGTRVTDEAYQVLSNAGFLNDEDENNVFQYIGLIALGLILMAFMINYLKPYKTRGALKFKETSLIFIVYIFSAMIISIGSAIEVIYLPLSIGTMLIAILIKKNIAIAVQIVIVIVSAFACKGDIIFITYILLTGITSIVIVMQMQQRKQTLKSAFFVGVAHFFVYLALSLLVGIENDVDLLIQAGIAFGIGVGQVIIVVGSLPLWEAVFGFITPNQLLELTNPDQPVLKRLLIEATGTYYHSLLVANLAESAADAIGANPLLTRVGGYYHDIGKISAANYFKENQVFENPHDYMDPQSSAQMILSHVTAGIEIADAYKLPKYVKDMVVQHHGTGTMHYFYAKAKEINGDTVNKEDFSYFGPKPQTKEAALIMLADVVEATVRAMQARIGVDTTVEAIVRRMVKEKLEEGQLDECDLYISDIEKIIQSFTHMLKGMHHERIEYPDRKG